MEAAADYVLEENWQSVDKSYLASQRAGLAITHLILACGVGFFYWLNFDSAPALLHYMLLGLLVFLGLGFLVGFFLWLPRKCKRLRYLVREQDIHFQRGYLFWQLISIANNRIQHLEVRQGPIERRFGLATLVIYTAGIFGSNLVLPGLKLTQAQVLKAQLINSINAEVTDEPL